MTKPPSLVVPTDEVRSLLRTLDDLQTAISWLTIARERKVRLSQLVAGAQKRAGFWVREYGSKPSRRK